ncbi:integrase domain protein SAM domain protein [Thermovibrio ammonificans HB-1]|uniref:Integrase domain protein SAM domain protein n=1 Tax=Thermovibrio ammonificans (strain DSM 15698 / JCM 12110 / HB-1) TaxID=648996 RepID=E8T2Y5_THEA1|nr:site-specific integrase [Thermovibrio ammonificans]ADU97194.1 integrase domain protein SAM domain protein [Thermovibrio ammonificans HB-1]
MEDFLQSLIEDGYKKNTIDTYRRVLRYFFSFLSLYNYDLTDFDEDKLCGYFSVRYKTEKSFRTAMSAIQHYLKFKGIKRRLRFVPPENAEFKEFRPITDDEIKRIELALSSLRSQDLQTAMLLIVHLGLSPSEIGKLKVSSFGRFMGIPVLQENKIKRFVINPEVEERLSKIKEEKLPISPLLSTTPSTIKVTFHRIMKQLDRDYTVADFKDNYVARLLKRGLPIDLVVEYSGRSLERVSYINRVLNLQSKADVIEKSLKEKT